MSCASDGHDTDEVRDSFLTSTVICDAMTVM